MATNLRGLFDRVMSGSEYDPDQVKAATNLTNTIVKVLRFEFDVYKHFAQGNPGKPGRPLKESQPAASSIASIAEWLRKGGDKVQKIGGGRWTINGRACEEKDLVVRANNLRAEQGLLPFTVS